MSVCAQGVRCAKASCSGVLLAPQRPAADAAGGAKSSNGAAPAPEEWACCECGRTKPGRTPQGGGCQDAVHAAQQAWQLSMALMQAGVRASRIVCSLSLSCWRAVVRVSRALLLGFGGTRRAAAAATKLQWIWRAAPCIASCCQCRGCCVST